MVIREVLEKKRKEHKTNESSKTNEAKVRTSRPLLRLVVGDVIGLGRAVGDATSVVIFCLRIQTEGVRLVTLVPSAETVGLPFAAQFPARKGKKPVTIHHTPPRHTGIIFYISSICIRAEALDNISEMCLRLVSTRSCFGAQTTNQFWISNSGILKDE